MGEEWLVLQSFVVKDVRKASGHRVVSNRGSQSSVFLDVRKEESG